METKRNLRRRLGNISVYVRNECDMTVRQTVIDKKTINETRTTKKPTHITISSSQLTQQIVHSFKQHTCIQYTSFATIYFIQFCFVCLTPVLLRSRLAHGFLLVGLIRSTIQPNEETKRKNNVTLRLNDGQERKKNRERSLHKPVRYIKF